MAFLKINSCAEGISTMMCFLFFNNSSDDDFRFQEAWNTCEKLNDKKSWAKLGENAVSNLEIEFGELL